MKILHLILTFLSLSLFAHDQPKTPKGALERLQSGSQRYFKEALIYKDRTGELKQSLSQGQNPFAVIVTCSDSRLAPEILFDEGIGELFVIRVAGNVVGPTELESIEYAVGHLNPKIVVIMGHQNCGAVDAVLQGKGSAIPVISKYINPAVVRAKKQGHYTTDLLKLSIIFNAIDMKSIVLSSKVVQNRVQEGTLKVYSAYHDLDKGTIEFLD